MSRMRIVGTRIVMFGIVAAGVLGLIVTGLWNALIPPIFGLPAINFWQALGLLILSRILFGGFGPGRGMRRPRFVRGWNRLTPEEQARFRQAMCGRPDAGEEPGQKS